MKIYKKIVKICEQKNGSAYAVNAENRNTGENQKKRIEIFSSNAHGPARF
jgi:hypothetical protein